MAYLQRNSYFKDLSGNEVFEGQPHKIEDLEYTSLRISVQTDVSGTLTVLQSLDGYTWNEFNDTFAISSTSHKQVDVKGRYVYVMYENGAAIASPFQLYSVLSKSGVSASGGVGLQEVLVVNESLAITGMNFDASGNLKVSGISGGGVSSDVNVLNFPATQAVSDASSHELLTDLSGAVWENTDRLLYDLDIIANHGDDASANAIAGNLKLDEIHTRLHDISGTVAISNQITGFATSAKQDSMLSDLDGILNRLHDVCGNVAVIGNEYENSRLKVFDSSAVEQLELVNFNIADKVEKYLFKPTLQTGQVDFDTYVSSLAQGSTWSVPADGQQGWAFNKTASGGATLYTYANSTLVAGGQEDDITLGSIFSMFFVANYPLVINSSNDKQFYLSIYTKPTGSGDAQPWYKSRKTYVMKPETIVSKGGDRFYWVEHDYTTIRTDLEHIEYQLAVQEGTCADSEIVQFIALQVDSAVPAGQFSAIVKMAGYSSVGNTTKVMEFGNYSREKIAEDNLKALTVQSGELKVKDASAVALLAEIANGITVQVGEVEISGNVMIGNFPAVQEVSGTFWQATQPVSLASLPDVSGTVSVSNFPAVQEVSGVFWPETQPVSLASLPDISGTVSVSNFPAVQNVYDASCELVLEGIKSQTDKLSFQNEGTYETLRVRVENPSSGGGVVEISGVGLVEDNLKVIDVALNTQFAQFSFFTDESEITDLRTRVMGSVEVENKPETVLAVSVSNFPTSQTVEISGVPVVEISGNIAVSDLSVNILNSSIDAHIFGSSDGTTWHHIKTNTNGVVATNAIMETDANGALTSENVTGTETYNALHTWIKNPQITVNARGYAASESAFFPIAVDEDGKVATTVSGNLSVQNATGTQLEMKAKQYGSYGNVANNLASLLPSSATAGIDVSNWSYFIGYYQDYNGATTGNIRLQYSFDNITYYNLFNTQIFPSGSSPRTATINKQDIPGINWIRLYNETSSTLVSVTLTLLGGSVS